MFLPLELTLRPSRIYQTVLALAHGLALAGIWLAALSVWVQLLMTATLIAGSVWLWRENLHMPHKLRVGLSGQIEMLNEAWNPAGICGHPVVLPWFVSLVLAPTDGKTRRLMLWSDSMDADAFRKFRVWLKWGKLPRP